MAMAMAMSRSVLARVARGGHPVYQPLLRAEGNLTADTLGKRFLSGFKGHRCYSTWNKLPTVDFEPIGHVYMTVAFIFGMGTLVPYAISSGKKSEEGQKRLEDLKAEVEKSRRRLNQV
ncbi:unnamed protein product [Triticum aestivum]|uniref:Uncharacterized protein n=2 Tax=Triticinae TaxID=1648030 RepID=A0A7H4LES5_WHEAT|nr:uncharacterized protein LOC109731472 isoform X2 [Aegilops tauschii subsp. strangulata]XP_044327989.1 uncharacterized protein LOC123049057 isoform X2 [Triticum aestivum]SPT17113.1 unnamed protein product [Triticum aestivum]